MEQEYNLENDTVMPYLAGLYGRAEQVLIEKSDGEKPTIDQVLKIMDMWLQVHPFYAK